MGEPVPDQDAWAADFSFDFLTSLYQSIRDRHQCERIGDAAPDELDGRAFIRHDVDLSVRHAFRMARLESALGLHTTYHVMVDCPFYSVEDRGTALLLQRIHSLGHEIGLHYDPANVRCGTHGAPIRADIEHCCQRLSVAIRKPVRSLSFHRPTQEFLAGPFRIDRRVNAYAAPLFEWYLSDSRARWREGNPLRSVEHPRSTTLQVLVHPIWWGPDRRSPAERLGSFVRSLAASTGRAVESVAADVVEFIGFPEDRLVLSRQ